MPVFHTEMMLRGTLPVPFFIHEAVVLLHSPSCFSLFCRVSSWCFYLAHCLEDHPLAIQVQSYLHTRNTGRVYV